MADAFDQANASIFLSAKISAAISSIIQEEHDPHYEPVLKLTEQVETKTHEEDEDVIFKM